MTKKAGDPQVEEEAAPGKVNPNSKNTSPSHDEGEEGQSVGGALPLEPMPQDLTSPQLTIRAIITGMLLGGVLSLCNIYAGLKVGWGFNMSIIAVLVSMSVWQPLSRRFGFREWGMLENNISQTTASSAASISSAGLVTAIPALTILTGRTLDWWQLAAWTLSVCLVGVFVGVALRRQMLIVDPLPFPAGTATAVTLKDLYGKDAGAKKRVFALLSAGGIAGAWLILHTFVLPVKKIYLNVTLPFLGKLRDAGITALNTTNLGLGVEPSMLMIGTGLLVGIRVAASMFFGAVVAWGILGPIALVQGWAVPGNVAANASWYSILVKWLLWPGVALMVTASLTSLAFSWRSIWEMIRPPVGKEVVKSVHEEHPSTLVPGRVFVSGMGVAMVISVILQFYLFQIALWMGVLSVFMTFLLAVVAARVSGITGIAPRGALGKVSQLTFGLLHPGTPTPNLMAANVTAGAAAQSADILHDMKTGYLIGASPRAQLVGQLCGIFAGSLIGSAAYLILVPDPKTMLLTAEWPAPAVAVWKSVAEIFMAGLSTMPKSAMIGAGIGVVVGFLAAVFQKVVPAERRKWFPSPAAFGLAFVLPATASATIFIGGMLLVITSRVSESWVEKYSLAIAAGLIAGESLLGIFASLLKSFF